MTDLRFEWNPKWKYGGHEDAEAIVVLTESVFLYLQVEVHHTRDAEKCGWSASAWTGDPNDKEWGDCWFATDCPGESNACDTLEEAQKCAENFVIHFRESLAREADLRREWLAKELTAIDRLKKILEERESND